MTTKDQRELANTMLNTDSEQAPSKSRGYVTIMINKKFTAATKFKCPGIIMPWCNRLTKNTKGSMPPLIARQ